MAQVIVEDGNIESAIRLLRRKVERDGFLAVAVRKMQDDPKPSVRRKKKARIANKRMKMARKRQRDNFNNTMERKKTK